MTNCEQANYNTATNQEWPAELGSWVERDPQGQTLCRSTRKVPWRLRPPSVEDVKRVLAAASAAASPVYPISCGCNWGYGSHLPASDGCAILDLSGLKQIGPFESKTQSVRIEPGVTQGNLSSWLTANAPDFTFNVTGAGLATSVLGNALERGLGYLGDKTNDVFGLEVLLADGSWAEKRSDAKPIELLRRPGLATDSIFFQTNFGVVVGGWLKLRKRQEMEQAVLLRGPFRELMETLRKAYEAKLITAATHMGEPGRTERLGAALLQSLWKRTPSKKEVAAYFPETGSYSAVFGLSGRRRVVKSTLRELRRMAPSAVKLRHISRIGVSRAAKFFKLLGARRQATRLAALEPLLGLTWGVPSDIGIASLDGYSGGDPDFASRGAIYGNAVSAFDPASAEYTESIVRSEWADSAFTWNILDERSAITIYTLHFDDPEADSAHRAHERILARFESEQIMQYRYGIDSKPQYASAIASRIKRALDPVGLLAPGRYGLS